MSRPKFVFIAHPISGDVQGNIAKVLRICKEIHSDSVIPVFPSMLWREYLSDSPEDKALAKQVNEAYFSTGRVDEVRVFGDRISEGMKEEILLARKYNIPVLSDSFEMSCQIAKIA